MYNFAWVSVACTISAIPKWSVEEVPPPDPIIYAIFVSFLGELCALLEGDIISCTIFVVSY